MDSFTHVVRTSSVVTLTVFHKNNVLKLDDHTVYVSIHRTDSDMLSKMYSNSYYIKPWTDVVVHKF